MQTKITELVIVATNLDWRFGCDSLKPGSDTLHFKSLLLTKASRLLSGDQDGTLIVP
jgi:hypothetical protein